MYIRRTNSTNTLIRDLYTNREHLFFVRTDFQTAGRGQSGNGWESEDGKNILISVLLKEPTVEATHQFRLSMAVALAVRDMLAEYMVSETDEKLTIKWPNDIYWENKKISGILIETSLTGNMTNYAIAGIGININQTKWISNAPNPISLKEITGKDHDISELSDNLLKHIKIRIKQSDYAKLKNDYMQYLYRRDGWYWYKSREVNTLPTMSAQMSNIELYKKQGLAFEGKITDITPQGEIKIMRRDGNISTYHFKEIQYVI